MITTVCLNPSFDRTVTLGGLVPGATNRALRAREDVGGKAINVAVCLQRLGESALCVGCCGLRDADRLCGQLQAQGLPHRFLRVPGAVRVNTKLVEDPGGRLTEINEPGPALSADGWEAVQALVLRAARCGSWAVFSGSLPPGAPEDAYLRLMQRLGACGVRCALDCGGAALEQGLRAKPGLVKPNLDELSQWAGRRLSGRREILEAARALLAGGAGCAVVSMGAEGALLVTAQEALFAASPRVPVHSSVGAGDAMVAGLLSGLAAGADLAETLRRGVAAGAASVMSDGTQLLCRADYEALLPKVRVRRFDEAEE